MASNGQQQPTSLTTVGRARLSMERAEDGDLLTLRILEASERKMQLIKQLLTPEQYSSLASDLFTIPHDFVKSQLSLRESPRSLKISSGDDDNQTRSVPSDLNLRGGREGRAAKQRQRFPSKSEAHLERLQLEASEPLNIRENLAKKRAAIEFFLHEPARVPVTEQENRDQKLAIELRFGHYLGRAHEAEEARLLASSTRLTLVLSLLVTIWRLFVSLCASCSESSGDQEHQEVDEETKKFLEKYQRANCLPYVRRNNLLLMRDRLKADGHFKSLSNSLVIASPQQEAELIFVTSTRQLRSIDLSKYRAYRVVIYHVRQPLVVFENSHMPTTDQLEIIAHHPLVEYLTSRPSERSATWSITIHLKHLKLLDHELMSSEDSLSLKLIDTFDAYTKQLKQMKRFEEALDKFLDSKLKTQASLDDFERAVKCLDFKARSLDILHKKQLELENIWLQLVTHHANQEFKTTGSMMIETTDQEPDKQTQQLNRIQQEFSRQFGQLDELDHDTSSRLDEIQRRLQSEGERKHDKPRSYTIMQQHQQLTPSNELPYEELERRGRLVEWVNSLHLKVLLDGCTAKEIHLLSGSKNGTDLASIVQQISKQSVTLSCSFRREDSQRLTFELYSVPVRMFQKIATLKSQQRLASTELSLDKFKSPNATHELEFKSVGNFTVRLEVQVNIKRVKEAKSCHVPPVIDRLHNQFFAPKLSLHSDARTKLTRLMNRIDPSRLASELSGRTTGSRYCILDPYEPSFGEPRVSDGVDILAGDFGLRARLLVRRWIEKESNPRRVYLSDRENLHLTGGPVSLDTFRANLERRSRHLQPQAQGYKAIEVIRAHALQYINQYERAIELLLLETRRKTDTQLDVGAVRLPTQRDQLKDLLIEPQIRIHLDLRQVLRAVRLLVPRPTARRPLMPDRHREKWHQPAAATKLSQLVDLARPSKPIGNQSSSADDVEHEAFGYWRALTSHRHHSHSQRLLVTIQQAQNVPLRVIPNAFALRPGSPFYAPGTPLGSTLLNQQATAYQLAPPTSYVEVVFQRRPLTSSLAQGKSPAWNETLFFNIHEPTATGAQGATCQLADEYLQVNLYDCRCYVQQEPLVNQQTGLLSPTPSQTATMTSMLLSDNQLPQTLAFEYQHQDQLAMLSGTPLNRLFAAQRQHVERHLIGSLRLPLTLLLSSGRIEGSFDLSQPLLLDSNYQFESPPFFADNQSAKKWPAPRTRLSLFITLDPPVSMPASVAHLPLASCEPPDVFVYARFWEQMLSSNRLYAGANPSRWHARGKPPLELDVRLLQPTATYGGGPGRHVRTLALNADDGQYRLLCRYLGPMKPPELEQMSSPNQPTELIAKQLARFVSLLSPVKYGHFKMRSLAASIWFEASQLLNKSLGGPEEKAVLLCNYFLGLGKCAALLLADAMPAGRCIYVIVWGEQLRRDQSHLEAQLSDLLDNLAHQPKGDDLSPDARIVIDGDNFLANLPILINSKAVKLWDPQEGVEFTLVSDSLPLVRVGSIVTCENIYANVQAAEAPSELSFDIRQRNLWLPLFSQVSNEPLQPGTLEALLRRDIKRLAHRNLRHKLSYLENLSQKVARPMMSKAIAKCPLDEEARVSFTLDQCNELRAAIEQSIKAHLLAWRPNRPTYFNRTVSRLIAERLATYEQLYFNKLPQHDNAETSAPTFADWRSDLAELIRSEVLSVPSSNQLTGNNSLAPPESQVISWPVNLSYTNMHSILDALHASGVHNTDLVIDSTSESTDEQQAGLSTQFLVACHVESYPARVLSVWLYVGAVVAINRRNLLL